VRAASGACGAALQLRRGGAKELASLVRNTEQGGVLQASATQAAAPADGTGGTKGTPPTAATLASDEPGGKRGRQVRRDGQLGK
jgi:hypothetical protein